MCEHKNTKTATLSKKFGSLTFTTKGLACIDCGADCWTVEAHAKYMAWLGGLYSAEATKEQFSVQVLLPAGAVKAINAIATRFPGIKTSVIVRALFAAYNDHVAPRPALAAAADAVAKMPEYQSFQEGERTRVNVRFKPASYEDLRGLAEAFEVPEAKIVENAVLCMLAVFNFCNSIREKGDTKNIAEMRSVSATIETVLKAA